MSNSRPIWIKRISQSEFGAIAYCVMEHVFAIHNEFGRLFEERIYKRELAQRMQGAALEVPITLNFESFSKTYYLDILVPFGALFEFKAVDSLHPFHRGQTINYLLIADLAHARIRLVSPETAFKLTAFPEADSLFAVHARRLIAHTPVTTIRWANISHRNVLFTKLP